MDKEEASREFNAVTFIKKEDCVVEGELCKLATV